MLIKEVTGLLKSKAVELGFEMVGVAEAKCPDSFEAYCRWIDAGMHAGMNYLSQRKDARRHPESVLPGVRSLLMLGVSYRRVLASPENHPVRKLSGVAEYARGEDYHHWIRRRLKKLGQFHREIVPDESCRGVVDTAPILERQFAVEAGLGWIGKNTMLINEHLGSMFFLAALLTTAKLDRSESQAQPSRCGSCHRCLEACPTGALADDYVLDARRCLNYWTIEYFGPSAQIPSEIQNQCKDRFFGCDCCQNACPCNDNQERLLPGTVDPRKLEEDDLRNLATGTPLERKLKNGQKSTGLRKD